MKYFVHLHVYLCEKGYDILVGNISPVIPYLHNIERIVFSNTQTKKVEVVLDIFKTHIIVVRYSRLPYKQQNTVHSKKHLHLFAHATHPISNIFNLAKILSILIFLHF